MTKKVLVVSSSPRSGGNSDILCDQFIKGVLEAGHFAEKISLRDKRVEYCLGCDDICLESGHCAHNDDMAELLEKMIECDVLVLATPVYFCSMSSQLKTFIDRVSPRYEEIKGKEFYFILTGADTKPSTFSMALEGLLAFMRCLPDAVEKGVICGFGVHNKGEIEKSAAMQEAYEKGRSL